MFSKFYYSLILGSIISNTQAQNSIAYSDGNALDFLADTNKLAEVIIKENRLQIPFAKQSRQIQLIDQQMIKQLPARSINELLAYVAGVDLRQRGPFGTQADVSIDGGSFDQTMVLINGVKVSDSQTGHHALNIPIPTDAIERIEILKGPAARLYGINSLTGAINIVTKNSEKSAISAHLYGGTSFRDNVATKKGYYFGEAAQLGAEWVKEKHRHQLYYGFEKTNGQRYNTAAENQKVYYQGAYMPAEQHKLNWSFGYLDNAFGANGYYAAPGDKESYEHVKNAFSSLSSTHKLSEQFSLSPRISNRYQEDDYRYLGRENTKGRSKHYNNTFSAELNASLKQSYGDFGFGIESRLEDIKSTAIGDHKRQNHGAYMEFKTEQINKLYINIGAYINYNSDYNWQVFPGIDLGYDVTKQWKIVFNTGTAQRIPSFTDLYLRQTGNIGNPNLVSENAWQSEFGVKYLSNNMVFQAGYFYRNISQFIDWLREEGAIAWQSENRGNNKMQGFQTNLRYEFQGHNPNTKFFINAGYNYLRPQVATLAVPLQSKYEIESLRHQLIGNITVQQGNFSLTSANRYSERISQKSYYISDFRLAYEKSSYRFYIDAQNIFDVRYIEAAAIPMPGRWYTMGVKVRLER